MAFKDKKYWALILGGSSGIGLATAKKLASKGLNICIVHRDVRSRMNQAEKGFEDIRNMDVNLLTCNLDATSGDAPIKVAELIKNEILGGKVKTLIHAVSKGNLKSLFDNHSDSSPRDIAGDELSQKFQEIDNVLKEKQEDIGLLNEADITITHQAMSTSLIYWCRELLNQNLFSESARVIALTSEGNKRIWHSYVAIAMAKSSLETLVKYLAKELALHNITANIIQAGITDTPSLRMIPGNEVIKASTINRNPFGRLTKPEDVANFIYLLCLDEASWVNGAIIPVDGGEHFC